MVNDLQAIKEQAYQALLRAILLARSPSSIERTPDVMVSCITARAR